MSFWKVSIPVQLFHVCVINGYIGLQEVEVMMIKHLPIPVHDLVQDHGHVHDRVRNRNLGHGQGQNLDPGLGQVLDLGRAQGQDQKALSGTSAVPVAVQKARGVEVQVLQGVRKVAAAAQPEVRVVQHGVRPVALPGRAVAVGQEVAVGVTVVVALAVGVTATRTRTSFNFMSMVKFH